jgi:hypothetical protein
MPKPSSFDLRTMYPNFIPGILAQQSLGDCVGNEISNACKFCMHKQSNNQEDWQPSRLYVYYFGRLIDGLPIEQDSGMSLYGCLQGIDQFGVCNEDLWSYDITKFSAQPDKQALAAGAMHGREIKYTYVLQELDHIKIALTSGFPIAIGIQIYPSFKTDETKNNGIIQLPKTTEISMGWHCVCIWGFDDVSQTFICSNSWGIAWGLPSSPGYFTIPYQYILNPTLCSEMLQVTYFK